MCTPKPQIAKEEDNRHRKWRWIRKYPANSPEESSKQQNFSKLHPAPPLVPIPPFFFFFFLPVFVPSQLTSSPRKNTLQKQSPSSLSKKEASSIDNPHTHFLPIFCLLPQAITYSTMHHSANVSPSKPPPWPAMLFSHTSMQLVFFSRKRSPPLQKNGKNFNFWVVRKGGLHIYIWYRK